MATMAIDTLRLAQELRASDLPQPQAEAIANAIGHASADSMSQAASKTDLETFRFETKAAFAGVEAKIEAMQSKLLMWFVSTQIAVGALIIALIKL